MGYRPNQPSSQIRIPTMYLDGPRCWHDPLPVHTVITEELVGHICSKCLETCDARPVPPDLRPPPRPIAGHASWH